ncbi:MAG TPA: cytidine deaminase [Blastocatellia bacterium]|nr:cytidine deaminase [Blastocatellia bacterium]
MGKRRSTVSDDELIGLATEAREFAHAPYSNFAVGAALLSADGRIFTGCNIEISTLGLTTCAERVAIFKAVSDGVREIARVAIVADHVDLAPPCGCCRQMMWEFGTEETEIILANLDGRVERFELKQLFPHAFDSSFLESLK